MNITLNGEPKEVQTGQTLRLFLTSLEIQLDAIAVVVNQAIVPKSLWSETEIQENDTLELFSAVAGG